MRNVLNFLVRHHLWGWATFWVVVGFGLFGYSMLKFSFFPELPSRVITIQVAYPGASPEEMEDGAVIKIEENLNGLEGIEEVTSFSRENTGVVNVELRKGYNVNKGLTDIKNAVDRITNFPEDAEEPEVFLQKSLGPAITVVLEGDVSLKQLKQTADQIEDDLLATGFISQITVSGLPELELAIELREKDLLRYNLTFDEVATAVRLNNQDVTGGSIRSEEEEVLIRSEQKTYDPREIEQIIVRTNPDGSIIRLKDVAHVTEQFSEDPDKTIYNDNPAVTITVQKLPEEDILKITDHVKEYLADFNKQQPNMHIAIQEDQSVFLWQRIFMLLKNGAIGLVLVLITLGIFLNVRLSLWVAMAIPFCFLGMFFIAMLSDVTINMISLFGMILVIGILVDDGIVVGENIFAHYEKGKSRFQSAVDGTLEVLAPIFASVITTMMAFSLIFFMDGRIGEFVREMAIVVIATLAFSLVEAAIILPSHLSSSWVLNRNKKGKLRNWLEARLEALRKVYRKLLNLCVRFYPITFASSWFIVFFIFGLLNGGIIKSTLFPAINRDDITINLVLPPGTREQITEDILQRIEEDVWAVNDSLSAGREDSNEVMLATKIDIGESGNEQGSHTGTMSIKLLDGETRGLGSEAIVGALRDKIGVVPEADKFSVTTRQPFGKPVSISLNSNNLQELYGAKELLKEELRSFPSLQDVVDNDVLGRREIKIKLKPQAFLLGLTQGEIARQIRQGFFGQEIQRLQKGTDELRVWVRYVPGDRKSIGQLEDMKIKLPTGQEYPLSQLIDYDIERGLVTINHLDGSREITIEADVSDPDEPIRDILAKIEETIIPEIQEVYPTVRSEFKGQQEENEKLSKSVMQYGSVILLLIFVLLSLVFNSWTQSILILTLLPFGFACAVLGHGVEMKPVSILSMYGIIGLSGVIINDSVVFLDKFNRLLKEGNSMHDALMEAGFSRFRPILLTSITTVAGLYPLILARSIQAQFLIPMAISVAYGVLFGTAFILTYFPAFLLVINDIRRAIYWIWNGRWPSREEVEPAVYKQKKIEKNEQD